MKTHDHSHLPIHEYDASEDQSSNPSQEPNIFEVANSRLNRRNLFKGAMVAAAAGALAACGQKGPGTRFQSAVAGDGLKLATQTKPTLGFKEISHAIELTHGVAEGYNAEVLIRWGDAVLPNATEWNPQKLDAASQLTQFGYNCDFIGYMPLPIGSNNSNHGLLCVNHEYTNRELMFPGVKEGGDLTKEQVDVEMAAHGHSVIEVKKTGTRWEVVANSQYARRITMLDTVCEVTGPAAGHDRLKTSQDPTGTRVVGTINNCAGGVTPWGTVLIAEENFHGYFGGDPEKAQVSAQVSKSNKRYGVPGGWYVWHQYYDRMNIEKEPNEPHRFGWLVEIDPYDPNSVPKKRTALGRFKHEAANIVINQDGHVVVYSGDDQRFDYVYKFVSKGKFNPSDRKANMSLLDEGTLYVARFNADGTLDWLPLVQGQGPLVPANGFRTQADVVIDARLAADELGATPMDRPEDVETNPLTGKVYMACTNNSKRKPGEEDAANPRANNSYGHIIEMIPPGFGVNADHTATRFTWNIFLKGGNPKDLGHGAQYHAAISENGWLAAPDNVSFDKNGRLYISTDQGSAQAKNGIADGIYITETEGFGRALTKFFFKVPRDAEMCGPMLTPDAKTLFVAVQHPAESKNSTYENPSTRWPDFQANTPPRPSVVAITKQDGGEIGS